MSDDHEYGKNGWIEAIRNRLSYVIGFAGLVAWLVMLWLMFGDVL